MKGRIFMILFALPFLCVGVWMGHSIGSTVADAIDMRDWRPVDATVSSAGYETHSGDDSDTYEAYGRYRYLWQGHWYEGDRVSLSGGADNVGDYQRDLGNRLRDAMQRGQPVTVFVNPEAAWESVIERQIRWGLIGFKSVFVVLFGGFGLGLIVWSFRAPGEKDPADPRFADAPWLANDAWQTPVIRSGSRAAMWFAWGIALFWNLVSSPLPFVIHREVTENGNLPALVGLLFPLIGAGLLYRAVTRTLEWRRFGPAPVTLDPFPGSIGGNVGGTIDINLPYDPSARFSLTLTSVASRATGSGDSRSRKETAEWQDTQAAHSSSGPRGTRLGFRFNVPEGLQASDAVADPDSRHLWRLTLRAELAGTNIDRDYEIPVYRTARKSAGLAGYPNESATSAQREADLREVRGLIRIRHDMDGKHLLYPAGRHLWNGLGGLLIGLVFAGAGLFLAAREDHWIMGTVFGAMGSLIALSGFTFIANSLEVIQAGDTIRTVRRIFGIPVRRRAIQRSDFLRFSRKSTLQTRTGSRHVMYFTLFAVGRSGARIVVGEGFRGAGQTDAAAALLASELGLTHRKPVVEWPDPDVPNLLLEPDQGRP